MFCFALLLVFIEYENNITLPVFFWIFACYLGHYVASFFGFSLVILG